MKNYIFLIKLILFYKIYRLILVDINDYQYRYYISIGHVDDDNDEYR